MAIATTVRSDECGAASAADPLGTAGACGCCASLRDARTRQPPPLYHYELPAAAASSSAAPAGPASGVIPAAPLVGYSPAHKNGVDPGTSAKSP